MHESVLLKEILEGLALADGDIFVDGTLGRAGHMIGVLESSPRVYAIGIDEDEDAIRESEARLARFAGRYSLYQGNFRAMDAFVAKAGKGAPTKVLLDLGVSSPQIDSSGRGFTFRKDEPLMMTMAKNPGEDRFTASDIVNGWAEEDIANVIYSYGEERYARRIAKAIVLAREAKPVATTTELVSIIEGAVPSYYRRGLIHPATRTFQALRIAVNDELGALREGLRKATELLAPGGRIAVIAFHSLEDRIVKEHFKGLEKEGAGRQLTKKPQVPSDEEKMRNPRSRSSKLRIFIKN